jgi:hypothetical protein
MKRYIYTIGSIVAILAVAILLAVVVPGRINRAFAASTQQTCANTNGTIMAVCEQQFPTVQNCVADAKSVRILPAYNKGVLVGEVDLRHSDACNSYWVRTMAYGSTKGLIINVEANNTFTNGMQDNEDNMNRGDDGSLLTFTAMTYKNAPQIASGVFDLTDNTSITVTL